METGLGGSSQRGGGGNGSDLGSGYGSWYGSGSGGGYGRGDRSAGTIYVLQGRLWLMSLSNKHPSLVTRYSAVLVKK